jgi:hypothetical protein
MSQFTNSRARAQQELTDNRTRAVRTVAGQARDRDEFVGLLAMLGLDNAEGEWSALSRSLADYVQQVAAALGVPAHAVAYEVSDTATAYLGLMQRSPNHPTRDLMLVWDEKLGWYLAVETHPEETVLVLSHLRGDVVPDPAVVARFVGAVIAGGHIDRLHSVQPPLDRISMAKKMAESRVVPA